MTDFGLWMFHVSLLLFTNPRQLSLPWVLGVVDPNHHNPSVMEGLPESTIRESWVTAFGSLDSFRKLFKLRVSIMHTKAG